MGKSAKSIMRKLGDKRSVEETRKKFLEEESTHDRREHMSIEEVRHDKYRTRQKALSELGPAADRLPIYKKEDREEEKKTRTIQFEAPIKKLIERYRDPEEIFQHMSYGQLMKYELRDGKIYEKGKLIYDGTKAR